MKKQADQTQILSGSWSAPSKSPCGEVGGPLVCVASTYTFHAAFFESELLPRFLGLRFDDTEGVRPFVVEREQALGAARVCALVDADHLDPSQTTLRWDQLPVRVSGGVQHAKVTVLLWEHYARLIVASANLTRQGFRRNREIAGVVDFFDDETSAPRRLIADVLEFLQEVTLSVRASEAAVVRLQEALDDARARVRSWRRMPMDFSPLEKPRATFVGGLPARTGRALRSPLEQLLGLWGTRRAEEIIVMTPFVGDMDGPLDPVVEKLLQVPRTRDTEGSLVVPGQPSEENAKRMVVGLPRRFRDAWASAWGIDAATVNTYVVPRCRASEKANRDLHAKGVYLRGDSTAMLLCGSSNFSSHGMGVRVANVEANLCYVDGADAKQAGLRLHDRMPVDWDKDLCDDPKWADAPMLIDDERQGTDIPLPAAFLWATLNQRLGTLTIAVDPKAAFPSAWWLRLPGEAANVAPPLLDHQTLLTPPASGRIELPVPSSLRGAAIAGLRVSWQDASGTHSGTLPVHVERGEDLLPPEEFRSLTASGIVDCLLSGRDAAEWVEAQERQQERGLLISVPPELDSLRAVDTTGYLLYRTRRFGAALAAAGERILRTVRTREAIGYRLRQDPLGPRMLATALVREWEESSGRAATPSKDPSAVLFSLAELMLMIAHLARQVNEKHLNTLFRETSDEIEALSVAASTEFALPANLREYLAAVRRRSAQLLRDAEGSGQRAG